MQIHRVQGKDLNEALQRARRAHGEDAVVLGHETTDDGHTTIAVANRPKKGAGQSATKVQDPTLSPRPASFPAASKVVEAPSLHPAAQEVGELLIQRGCSEAWVRRLLAKVGRDPASFEHPIDQAASAIGGAFRIAHLSKQKSVTQIIAYVGATGVGKTTSQMKLGARLIRGGHRLTLATLDTHRIGAVEQLKAYGELLGSRVRAVTNDTPMTAMALGAPGPEVVLLDTSGRPAYDLPRLLDLQDAVREEEGVSLQSYLVLPATMSRSALLEVTAAYGDLRLGGCIITKLDEAGEVGPVLEYVVEMGLPVAFLSDGQDLGRSLHRATPPNFADLMLRGSLS